MRRMRRALARQHCRLRGHAERCTMNLNLIAQTWQHTHSCDRCGFTPFSEIKPITAVALTTDLGLPIPQQRQYLN